MSCNCLGSGRKSNDSMLYDNLAVTATTAGHKSPKQKKFSESQIEWKRKFSTEPRQGSDDTYMFEQELEKYSLHRELRENNPHYGDVGTREDLLALLGQHIQQAKDAERSFEQRGRTRRTHQKTTQFLATFKAYIDAYGGVVEMMASAGGAYGHTAYSTMSIFLTIAANKQDRDDKIASILKQLCKHYSRFPTLERIHPSPAMKGYLEEAYKVGIDFARYASLYYLKSSVRRLWSVIYTPPELFEETLSGIADAIADVKDEREFRDSERLYRVEAAMEENRMRWEVNQREIQDAQRDTQLLNLREKILPDHSSMTQETVEYQRRLEAMFDGQRRDIMSRLPELLNSPTYKRWQQRERSSILALRGEARQETHFSWFSPLIMAICRDLQRSKTPVAFHCCQPRDTGGKGHRLVDVLNHLSFQLLYTMDRSLESEAYKSIRDMMNKAEWGKDAKLARDVLVEVIRSLGSVTLIVDRADLIRGDWEESVGIFCWLASKKASQGCLVKVVLLGSRLGSDWRDVKASMVNLLGKDSVFEITSAESDWNQ